MNPRAIKKANTISQTTSLLKPLNASSKVRVPVAVTAMRPKMETVPIGNGFKTTPNIVATKMAKRCIASGLTPSGSGQNQRIRPTSKQIPRVM